ncbi:MAG TPA: hypothetical protein VJ420_07640 [Candidatus Udaeobacter sp.]|nr:hypothetical protein [Candidatus Udaeobacter sp.]
MMRIASVVCFLVAFGCPAPGSDVYRYDVKRGSELEKELGYTLSVQDEHDEQRSQGMDAVIPIEGPAPDYWVKFRTTAASKLNDLFELDLSLNDAKGTLLRVPLAIRSRGNKENEIDVRFPIKKELINQAVLILRCAPPTRIHPEATYSIRLGDYAPANANAIPSPTPRSTPIPGPYHVIRLATLQDTGEQVAILDFKVFKSVEALKEHIGKFPWGSEVSFQRWLGPTGGPGWNNKFIKATDELKTFCGEHHITLTLSAVQPYY